MTAQEILKLIEEVRPDDTATLDEIDARVCLFVKTYCGEYIRHWQAESFQGLPHGTNLVECSNAYLLEVPKYTRSRDALKAIRPNGRWRYELIDNNHHGYWFKMRLNGNEKIITGYHCTEELAELHAIIQAIEYERTK